jgi:hypothetical protein
MDSIESVKIAFRTPDITRLTKIDIDSRTINKAILDEHAVDLEIKPEARIWQTELVGKEGIPGYNAETGALREKIANSYFDPKDYTVLDGKCGGNNCFDGVYINKKTGQLVISCGFFPHGHC